MLYVRRSLISTCTISQQKKDITPHILINKFRQEKNRNRFFIGNCALFLFILKNMLTVVVFSLKFQQIFEFFLEKQNFDLIANYY